MVHLVRQSLIQTQLWHINIRDHLDRKICHPEDAIAVVGEFLSEMDREVMCVLNLKEDGTPVNCNFASIGAVNHAIAEPRESSDILISVTICASSSAAPLSADTAISSCIDEGIRYKSVPSFSASLSDLGRRLSGYKREQNKQLFGKCRRQVIYAAYQWGTE